MLCLAFRYSLAIRCVLRESQLAHDDQSGAQLRTVKCQENLHKTTNAVRFNAENVDS